MQSGLFRTSCLAVFLGFALPSALADETHDAVAEVKAPVIAAAGSDESIMLSEAQSAADLLDEASMIVLAGPGDRETAAIRRDAAQRLADLADMIRKDTSGIVKSEVKFLAARAEYDAEYDAALHKVEAAYGALLDELSYFGEEGQPAALTMALPKLKAAEEALHISATEGVRSRTLDVVIELPEAEYPSEVIETIKARVAELEASSGIKLDLIEAETGNMLELSGKAPLMVDALDIRQSIESVFAPREAQGEEEAEMIELPKPVYLAISLD